MPQVSSKQIAAATATYRRPHHRLAERGLQLLQPWLVWLAVTLCGLGLRYGFAHQRLLTVLLVLLAGGVLFLLDAHLRQSEATLAARWAGPVTVAAATVSLAVYLVAGYSKVLLLVYLLGGGTMCVWWDRWILSADTRDLAAVFNAQAAAAGAPGARMTVMRQRESRGAAPGVVKALLRLPRDPAMTAEETADRVGHMENVTGRPAGSFSLSGLPDHGGVAEVTIAPPSLLTAKPLPWPGPYAPGADMSVPFRPSRLADGRDFLYHRLPVHHRKVTGKTGLGKALALNTLVPTPAGWATMGDLRDGDLVFDEAGQPCRVTRAWPVRHGRPCYEVKFSDGSVIIADAEHLWLADTRSSRNHIRQSAQPRVVDY